MTPIVFAQQSIAAQACTPAADRILAGAPTQQAWNHYTDPTEQFFAGIWAGEPGAWRVIYAAHEEEFCVLLEGEVRLTDDRGHVTHLRAGDAFVIPGGFTGQWENLTRVRKHYAIMTLKETTP